MPQRDLGAIGNQSPKPRVVQYRRRRYSIRLEPAFWQSLERLAVREGMRLGRFVADLADGYRGANFASYLRVICMLQSELAIAEARLQPTTGTLLDVVMACDSPGLLLSRERTLVAYNNSFVEWLGPSETSLTGAELTSVVQVRTREPLNELWQDLCAGKRATAEANVLRVEPGRVSAAAAKLIALRPVGGEEFYALMWLSARRRPAHGPAPR